MSRPPFNTDGVPAKIRELQALPDKDRKFEVHLMRTHFQSWMERNFSLEDRQLGYLYSMDPTFVQELSGDIADCIEFRLPFEVRLPPGQIPTHGSKFVQPRSGLVRSYDPVKGYIVTGDLEIVIEYK